MRRPLDSDAVSADNVIGTLFRDEYRIVSFRDADA